MSDDGYQKALERIKDAVSNKKTELDLSELDLRSLPFEIFELTNLQTLDLHGNHINDIPESLSILTDLRSLTLARNHLVTIPNSLGALLNLRSLDLTNNKITVIPNSLGALAKLEFLDLSDNQISLIPSSIGNFGRLKELFLDGNRISAIPESLGNLVNLQVLFISRNQITEIPICLRRLAKLKTFSLFYNQLTYLPELFDKMQNLEALFLDSNRLTELPQSFGFLTGLRELHLYNNELIELPSSLNNIKNLTELYLHGNPQLGLPAEVLGPFWNSNSDEVLVDPAEILEYYFRARINGRALNEAKLILVGRGAVGKTSLVKRLIYNKFTLGESKTEGINIERWEIPIDDEKVRLNVWDFGGQEIMHATHQFFLTERSLYLLVLSGRDGGEDAEAEYWLKLIESFGANSPVIIVLNKISEHAFDLNRNALLHKYPNIRDITRTDCRDNIGVDELKALIFSETAQLDELHVRFPGEWFAVKDYLASTKENYLSFEQYRDRCDQNDVNDPKHQEMLARYLNQLGIILNYKDDPRLRDTHVLNPHWVTEGIYKILNWPTLEENHGVIFLNDVSKILTENDYPMHMCRFIFDLMKKFDLCFSFPDDECHYLIPELLPKNEPDEAIAFDLEECLNFQYHYPVLPEGLLPRFITRTHHLSEGERRWRSGVILKFEECRALVKADAVDKRVFISVSGNKAESRRRLLAVIRADFERIHRDIKNLNPQEMVPLPGLPNDIVPYQDLLVMESKGKKDFPKVIGTEVKDYKISELLNGVDLPRQQKEKDTKALSLFYSYAHEDETYKMALETHLKILHRQGIIQGWSDREIGAGENWRKAIMEKLNGADIILLLISSDFMASDFAYDIEMKRAMERHDEGEARVIPVIVRDCIWTKAPFSKLQAMPKEGKSVDTWDNKDSAWRNVAEGIEKAATSLGST